MSSTLITAIVACALIAFTARPITSPRIPEIKIKMSFDKKQITDFTERILKRSGMYSHEALDQMLKTLAQESHFGTYL
ncbi:MAG: hypothetical protein ABIK92_00535, partial [Pseudomonadota bacterium]